MFHTCPECKRIFTRHYDMMRHKRTIHPDAVKSAQSDTASSYASVASGASSRIGSESLSTLAESDAESFSSSAQGDAESTSTDEDSEIEEHGQSVWDDIVDDAIDMHAADIEEAGEDDQTLQEAYANMRTRIMKTVMALYEKYSSFPIEMKENPTHRSIMKTKQHLQEDMSLPPLEALKNAIKMRKQLFKDMVPSEYPRLAEDEDSDD